MEPKGGCNDCGEGGSAEAAVPEAAPSAATEPSGTAAAERRDSADRWQRIRESQLQIPPAQRLPVTSQRSCTTVCHHHHSTLGGTCRESLRRSPPARRHPLLAAISATIQCMRLASFMPQARVALGCAPTHTRERHFEYPIEPGTLGTLERWRRRRQQRRQRLRQGEQLGIQPGLPVARVYHYSPCVFEYLAHRYLGARGRRRIAAPSAPSAPSAPAMIFARNAWHSTSTHVRQKKMFASR